MGTHTLQFLSAKLKRGSILWRAVLYSVLVSAFTVTVLSAISYIFMVALIQRGSVDIDIYQLLQYVAQLGRTLLLVGGVSLLLSIVLSFSFGHRLAQPFLEMQEKVEKIQPGRWHYRHTIHTGDEAEQLDATVADLTRRLAKVYAHLEEEIAARTKALEEEYEKDRTILKSVHIGILVINKQGIIVQANPAAMQLLKLQEKDALGKAADDVLVLRQKAKRLERAAHPVYACLKTGEAIGGMPTVHTTALLKNGGELPVRISVAPLRQKRTLLGAVALFQDVTMERQLDYMKTDFLTLASHHLRTPLSTLQWYLELFTTEAHTSLTSEQKSFLMEMRLATKKMALVLGELMDASRLSEGGFAPVFQNVDVRSLVEEVTKSTKSLLDSHKVTCSVEMPERPEVIRTDPLLASIVLQNFLHNAAKYSRPGGGVVVSVKNSGEHIIVQVADHGIGIPYAEQELIFEKLYRASNARAVETNGAGLGLYSCKMIAEKIGAFVSFVSEEGKGSTFTVAFPPAGKIQKREQQKKHTSKKR